MGERKIIEEVEVPDSKEVYLCDFCGRSSDELEGSFNDVHVNGSMGVVNRYTRFGELTYDSEDDLSQLYRWIGRRGFEITSDDVKHFCDECHAAHLGVHNDTN